MFVCSGQQVAAAYTGMMRGSGRNYIHFGMHADLSLTRIRGRLADGSERHLYLLTIVSVGEDADVSVARYPSLDTRRQHNRWLWQALD